MATSIEELEVRLKNNKEYLEKIQNDIKLIEEELVLLKSASSIGSATGADIKPVQAHDKVNPLNEKETQTIEHLDYINDLTKSLSVNEILHDINEKD